MPDTVAVGLFVYGFSGLTRVGAAGIGTRLALGTGRLEDRVGDPAERRPEGRDDPGQDAGHGRDHDGGERDDGDHEGEPSREGHAAGRLRGAHADGAGDDGPARRRRQLAGPAGRGRAGAHLARPVAAGGHRGALSHGRRRGHPGGTGTQPVAGRARRRRSRPGASHARDALRSGVRWGPSRTSGTFAGGGRLVAESERAATGVHAGRAGARPGSRPRPPASRDPPRRARSGPSSGSAPAPVPPPASRRSPPGRADRRLPGPRRPSRPARCTRRSPG